MKKGATFYVFVQPRARPYHSRVSGDFLKVVLRRKSSCEKLIFIREQITHAEFISKIFGGKTDLHQLVIGLIEWHDHSGSYVDEYTKSPSHKYRVTP